MKKKELLRMRQLKPTARMVALAKKDVPKTVTIKHGAYSYQTIRREYQLYMRVRIEGDILKAALYYPDYLRAESRLPSYEVFIDRSAQRFITYDRINSKWLTAKVDRLEWPQMSYPFNVWVSAADNKAVQAYFGSEQPAYDAILSYQLKLREEARIRRHKKQTDKWDADMALIPAIPKDWDRWVDKVGIPHNFIFYQYQRRGAKTGYCTYCEKNVPIQGKPRHNKEGRCPCCRHKITYKSVGRLGWRLDTEEVCVYLIQAIPNGFVIREFWADRRYSKEDYKSPKVYCVEHWRMVYDHDMDVRTYYWGHFKQFGMRWVGGEPSYSPMGVDSIYINHGNQPGRIYGKTLPSLAKGILKHTGLAEWIYAHGLVTSPDKYMTVCKNLPQFEQIWKAGLPTLAEECWRNRGGMFGLIKDSCSPSLTKALGIDKQGLARLRRYNGGHFLLHWLQMEKQSGKPISDEVLEWFQANEIETGQLNFIWDKMSAIQVCHYLQRQMAASQETAQQVITTWRDYLSMAERLGIDTNDEIIYRVKLLRQRHDELVLRCKRSDQKEQAVEVLKDFPKVDKVCRSIREKYEYANDEYAIIAPNGVLDILVEGDMLCHCLRGSDRYWDRIQTHESYILFLRRASALDTPYYTLEVEPDGTVRQKRTKFDRQEDDIKEAVNFLTEWQGVLSKRLTRSDRKKAANSRVLREQEFEQMRQDNVLIRTGDLAGRRLVDVLIADLLEAAA